MHRFYHTFFWILAFLILTLGFSRSFESLVQSFYFVAFLFPVIVGTSYLVASYLVPRFLLQKKYFKFGLYFIYVLVFSVFMELLVMTLSLVVLANFQYEAINPKATDIVFLTIVLYTFVFLNTIILLIRKYFMGVEREGALQAEKDKRTSSFLVVRSDRKNIQVLFDQIEYVESTGNYLRIHTSSGDSILTKEKISSLQEKLTDSFLRIHRSILVNRDKIQSYNRERITVNEMDLPLSRKYKAEVMNKLGGPISSGSECLT